MHYLRLSFSFPACIAITYLVVAAAAAVLAMQWPTWSSIPSMVLLSRWLISWTERLRNFILRMPGYKKGQKYDAPFVPYPIPVVLSRKGFFWFIFHYFFLFSTMVSHRFFHSTPWLAPPPWTLILSQRKTTFVGGERYTQNEIHFWQRR